MKPKVSYGPMVCVLLAGLSFTGCATRMPQSGFLDDYSAFERVYDDAALWSFVDPDGVGRKRSSLKLWGDRTNLDALAQYDAAMVERPTLKLNKNSPANWISDEKINRVIDELYAAFLSGLTEKVRVVNEPGERVLKMHGVFTDMSPIVAYQSPDDIAALTWANSNPGTTQFEMEAVDSVSGERVIAMIGSGRGSPFDPLTTEDPWEPAIESMKRLGQFYGERMTQAQKVD